MSAVPEVTMPTLRIGTWNCFGVPQDLFDFVDGTPFWPARLDSKQLSKELSTLDVLCVQENMVRTTLAFLRRLLDDAGFRTLHFDRRRWDVERAKGLGSGLAILTKGGVAKIRVHPVRRFGKSSGIDRHAMKGFQVAELELTGGLSLLLVNTHLQANDPSRDEAETIRRFQLAEIRDAVSNTQGRPLLICGDFNIDVGSREHTDWEADWRYSRGLIDLAAASSLPTLDSVKNDLLRCREPHSRIGRVDYILAPQHVGVRDVRLLLESALSDVPAGGPCGNHARAFASDHFGLVAEIEVQQ